MSSLNGTQAGINVAPAAAMTLVVAGFPSPTTAGAAENLQVTAFDTYGNVATGYAGTVQPQVATSKESCQPITRLVPLMPAYTFSDTPR